ncbi:MAG TPA: DNA gyrase subunit A [Candidatus Omnitrophica bacterium]|nr:DNA gyrase subunit A [Candidatus Omnitrophota bacterium]
MYSREQNLKYVDIKDEMKDSYLSYAMSVIIGRALPDAKDGLKPVHRRILYAMKELGLESNKPYKKSARIVGEVLGKYHPHGDTAVYDSLVRMAQEFSMRYPLIDGQGNFGSVDGDPAAAMRYTEARLAPISQELLEDLEKGTVNFRPNFDESLQEPVLLPSKIPNLLINGSSGIAVGMATNIPPHNLSEVISATAAYIDNPDISVKEITRYIPGPDFPTGGILYGSTGLKDAYTQGKGIVKIRARAVVEQLKGNREAIVVKEIPYQVNKANLIEQIVNMVKEKKIEGISDLRDESDKEGIRIVIELKKEQNAEIVLNQLYKHTQMEISFGIILLALSNNRPQVLNIKQLIAEFVQHRKDVVIRRTRFDLDKAERRAHIVEGLKLALASIDRVVDLIKKSKSTTEAKERLMQQLKLTDIQAQAILEMQLQRLTRLEVDKLENEYLELIKKIAYLKSLLASEQKVMQVIKEELLEIKECYGDDRMTDIVEEVQEIEIEDLIAEEDMVVTISSLGYIKRQAISAYKRQRRGGKGVIGIDLKEGDFVRHLFIASTHDYMLFFTNNGRLYWLKVHEIPAANRIARGKAVVNLLSLSKEESIAAYIPVRDFKAGYYLVLATAQGIVKKIKLDEFDNPRRGGVNAISLKKGDSLIRARVSDGTHNVFMATKEGKSICFTEKQLRSMGRNAQGVKGITLSKSDTVVSMCCIKDEAGILTVSDQGFGKRTLVKEYRVQSRAGKGVINMKLSQKTGKVIGADVVSDKDDLVLMTESGQVIRTSVKDVRIIGRSTSGVRIVKTSKNDKVVSFAKVVKEEE